MRNVRFRSPQARDAYYQRRADAERAAGIPDRVDVDCRLPIPLDLRCAGGDNLLLRPCRRRIAWRAVDVVTGQVLDTAALKTLLHNIADRLPRTSLAED